MAREALCESIGRKGQEQELCVLNIVNHSPYYQATRVYLVSELGIQEIESLGGIGIYEMLVSPSRRYLAIVENAGEGHPELNVCDLDDILKGDKDFPCFAGFNPYPGGVYDLKWQGDVLTFSSEAPDLMLSDGEGEKYWHYALDAETGELKKAGEPNPVE